MQKIHFIKMHGLGNDFVIIDRRKNDIIIDKSIIKKLSDRKTGAGCDQLITIENSISSTHDAGIKIFNPNGDIAEACGNGARCVAKIIFEEKKTDQINLYSSSGILNAKKLSDNLISVNLGKISHNWQKIPLIKKVDTLNMPIILENFFFAVAVNVGNPHIVFFGKNIDLFDLETFGPKIENNKLFPNKTNVEIVEIINDETLKMRVWERGVGVTLACGSGACAAVYASILKNLTKNTVEVKLAKGFLKVKIVNNNAILIGPAEEVFKGEIEL